MRVQIKSVESPMNDAIQDYIIEMLLSLAQMAADVNQVGLAERIRHAADSSVVYL